jgi:hypothetical protein
MPATDPDKNKPKPGHKHLNLPNVPADDLAALHHAAIDAGANRAEYLRELIHADAEKWRSRGKAGKASGHKFEFVITGMTADNATEFWEELVTDADTAGFSMGGGYHRVDDDGNPAA